MRIQWSSNAPFSKSGYGTFTRDIALRLHKDGWPLSLIAWAGLAGGNITYEGIPCYPQMAHPFGSDALAYHGKHFQANVSFAMQDIQTLDPNDLSQVKTWIPYLPIDRDPIPQNVINNLRFAYKIITFSQFGHDALQRAGYASTLIPEGVDMSIFKPLDKMKTRKEANIPQDKFVVGMIGANKDAISRKGWQEALDAFKLFHDAHPESIFFYETNQPGGFDIQGYAAHLGLETVVVTPDIYMAIYHTDSDIINKYLNCFDVTLHPSSTEGFGLVIAESQSAGTPVIVNNTTSMPELIIDGKTGEIAQAKHKVWLGGSYIHFADPQSIYEKLEVIYRKIKENENKISTDCRNNVMNNYNIDTIFTTKWIPFLTDLQDELLPPIDTSQKKS